MEGWCGMKTRGHHCKLFWREGNHGKEGSLAGGQRQDAEFGGGFSTAGLHEVKGLMGLHIIKPILIIAQNNK